MQILAVRNAAHKTALVELTCRKVRRFNKFIIILDKRPAVEPAKSAISTATIDTFQPKISTASIETSQPEISVEQTVVVTTEKSKPKGGFTQAKISAVNCS